MGQVVLDSTDLNGIVRDATGDPLEGVKAEEKPPEVKAETKPEVKEEEDDDGLTPTEKRELTEKMQKAIAKRTRALREAEEFATEQYNERRMAEQRAETFEREINRLKTQIPIEKPPEELAKPTREKFETDEAFRDAMDDYRVEVKFREREQKAAQEKEAQRQAEVLETARTRVQKALELVPDYREVTEGADMLVPPVIAGYMQESELFAELGYYFAKNQGELNRLSKLSPAKALVEVGKIESKLEPFGQSDGRTEPKANGATPKIEEPNTETDTRPSKPRAPITPIGHGIVSQVEKPPNQRNYQEERAAWQKKHNANFSKRQRH